MKKNIFLTICTFLIAISIMQAADRALSAQQSLHDILLFINKSNPQFSPTFDPTVKPRVDYVKSALDKHLQKAFDDRMFLGDPSKKMSRQELKIAEFQKRLQEIYRNNPELFLSEEEEKKLKTGLSVISKTPSGGIVRDLASDQVPYKDDTFFDKNAEGQGESVDFETDALDDESQGMTIS